jgi:hypothetical protein
LKIPTKTILETVKSNQYITPNKPTKMALGVMSINFTTKNKCLNEILLKWRKKLIYKNAKVDGFEDKLLLLLFVGRLRTTLKYSYKHFEK